MQEGSYGDSVKLDGPDVIYAPSWPKAIHEGNDTSQLFITKKATEEQKTRLSQDLFRRSERRWMLRSL